MKFKKITQIENIEQFLVNRFGLFYLTNDLKIPHVPDIDLVRAGFERSTVMKLAGDFLIIHDTTGREILYDLKNKAVLYQHLNYEDTGLGLNGRSICGDRNLISCTAANGSYEFHIYNADSGSLTEIPQRFTTVLNEGKILLYEERKPPSISRVDLEGKIYWTHSIKGTYQSTGTREERPNLLERILGEHGELLWLADFTHELYALDIETGKKIYSCFDVGPAHCYSIDITHRRMVSLDREYLRQLDISERKFKLSKIDIKEVFRKLECSPDYGGRQLPIVDSHLIFCDKFKSVIGTIGIDDGQVNWLFDLFDTRKHAMIKEMKYFDRKLYVLDNVYNGNNLHIFEKVE